MEYLDISDFNTYSEANEHTSYLMTDRVSIIIVDQTDQRSRPCDANLSTFVLESPAMDLLTHLTGTVKKIVVKQDRWVGTQAASVQTETVPPVNSYVESIKEINCSNFVLTRTLGTPATMPLFIEPTGNVIV